MEKSKLFQLLASGFVASGMSIAGTAMAYGTSSTAPQESQPAANIAPQLGSSSLWMPSELDLLTNGPIQIADTTPPAPKCGKKVIFCKIVIYYKGKGSGSEMLADASGPQFASMNATTSGFLV